MAERERTLADASEMPPEAREQEEASAQENELELKRAEAHAAQAAAATEGFGAKRVA